jgi:hypothetical protein
MIVRMDFQFKRTFIDGWWLFGIIPIYLVVTRHR